MSGLAQPIVRPVDSGRVHGPHAPNAGPLTPFGPLGVLLAALALSALASHADAPAQDQGPGVEGSHVEPRQRPTQDLARALLDGRRLDLNLAQQRDLELLPGIGPSIARRIVDDRAAHGDYERASELTRVRGIGPRTLERLSHLVCAHSECEAPKDAGAPRATPAAATEAMP